MFILRSRGLYGDCRKRVSMGVPQLLGTNVSAKRRRATQESTRSEAPGMGPICRMAEKVQCGKDRFSPTKTKSMNSIRWTVRYYVRQVRARWRRYWHCLFHLHRPETWYYNGFTIIRCYDCDRNFSVPNKQKVE